MSVERPRGTLCPPGAIPQRDPGLVLGAEVVHCADVHTAPAVSRHPSSKTTEPYIWPVVGEHLDTLNAISCGLALLQSRLGGSADLPAPADIVAAEYPEDSDLLDLIRLLAEILVGEVAGADAAESRNAERSEAIAAINAVLEEARFRVTRRARSDALGDAGELLRETGLEFHDLECTLATDRDGKDVIVALRLHPMTAHASLIGRLFQRAEAFVDADENLAIEHAASGWFFDRWSEGMLDGDPAYTNFPRMVREQEWSLVSRDTLSLDEPIIASFTTDQEPADVPPRQQRLATAYARSTVGIFEVTAVDGPVVTVRNTSDGQVQRYHEHSPEAQPYPGLLILGRLIPLEDDLWLRSPGAVIIASESDQFRDMLTGTLTSLCETLPTPIALEGLISTAVYGAKVPVPDHPAQTIAQAQGMVTMVLDMLQDIGLLTDVPEAQAPAEVLDQLQSPALGLFGLGVDQPMAEWLGALFEQASLDTTPTRSSTSKRKQQRRAKQQQARRRKR